jgi:hypothetical protein
MTAASLIANVTTSADLTSVLADAPVLPAATTFYGVGRGDFIPALAIGPDNAAALGTDSQNIRAVGARSKAADTAADRLFQSALAADGGTLYLIPVPIESKDGRARANSSKIESALDKAYLRLSETDRTRILYGRAADSTQVVTVAGVQVSAIVPGMLYVMAVGGAVRSHPIMGRVYRELTAKH